LNQADLSPAVQIGSFLWSVDGETWSQGATIELPKDINGFFFRRGIAGNASSSSPGTAARTRKTWWCATSRDGQSIHEFRR